MQRELPDKMEDHFRQKLGQHQPNWDEESLWEAIEHQLPTKRKNRFFVFFFYGGSLLFLLVLFTYLSNQNQTNIGAFPVPKNQPQATLIESENVDVETTTLPIKAQFSNKSTISEAIRPKLNTVIALELKTKLPHELSINTSQEPIALVAKPVSVGGLDSTGQVATFSNLQRIEPKKDDLLNHQPTLQNLKYPTDPVTKTKSKLKYQVYSAYALVNRTLATDQSELKDYIAQRNDLEKPLETVQLGCLIEQPIGGNFTLKFGLEYAKLTERFSWQTLQQETIQIRSDSAFFYTDQNQQKRYLAGEQSINRSTSRQVTHYNTYTYYSVPIGLEYKIRKGIFDLNLGATAFFNLQQQVDGRFLNQNQEIEELADQNFSNRIPWSPQFNFGIAFPVATKTKIGLDLLYRWHTAPINKIQEDGFEQQYQWYGAQLSLKRNLFNY